MKCGRLFFVCLSLCLVLQASAVAEQPQWLSPEGRESLQGLNINLPAELPEGWAATSLADAPSIPEAATPWPTLDWSVSPPGAQGMDRAVLIEAFRYAIGNGSKAVVVTRHGYLWWLNTGGGMWPDAPMDAYAAMGLNEKRIFVVPSLDIVAVRLGNRQPDWDDNAFIGPICNSVTPAAVAVGP